MGKEIFLGDFVEIESITELLLQLFPKTFTCVKNSYAYHLAFFITHNDVVFGKFAIISMVGLFKINIKHIRLPVITGPYSIKRHT